MDVLLNEEEELLKRSVRAFLTAECPTSLVRATEGDELGYSPELWRQAADLGWMSLALPSGYGGDSAPLTHLGIVLEEIGRAAAPIPLHSTMVAALMIAKHGTPKQREGLLPSVARGEIIMTWSVIEEDARYLPSSVQTWASHDGDGFRINGAKRFVDNFRTADVCLVACRTAEPGVDREGVSLLIVDPCGPGVSLKPLPNMAGDRQFEVTFDNAFVPQDRLLGTLHDGWPLVRQMTEYATALLCAQMVGAIRKTVDLAVDYAKDRVAFGRPIGAFQSIAHICADIVTWMDAAALLTYSALWRLDQGLPATLEVAVAKSFCDRRGQMCLQQANQIHGGLSQIKDFDLNLWFRRAGAWSMRLGTTFDHNRTIVSEAIAVPSVAR
jgi:alkylation response protein AidB-like acyl-CoA dehydrogenase